MRESIPSNIPSHNQFIDSRHLRSQGYLDRIYKCSSLTKKKCDDLERVQKSAVRIILGKPYESYSILFYFIKEIGIMKLAERREAICLKFAKNSLRISNFRELFPI